MGHHHTHSCTPNQYGNAFFIATIANGAFVLAQIVFSYLAHSTSLLADAIHNLGDVLGLLMAWIAHRALSQKPTPQSTYGMKKLSILAAFANGLLLVFSCGIIAVEATYKFFSLEKIQAEYVIIVASIGILINGFTALLFIKGKDDINIYGAFLHLLYDAILSFGVVLTALLVYWTGWGIWDPIMGLLIAAIILKGTWQLFQDSFRLMLDNVPKSISWEKIHQILLQVPGVQEVHDLHIWALSTQENALSAHLWMPQEPLSDSNRAKLVSLLQKQHKIHHVTLQVEANLEFCEANCSMNTFI